MECESLQSLWLSFIPRLGISPYGAERILLKVTW